MDIFTSAYIEAIAFTECHSDNPDLEHAELSQEAIEQATEDCADFQEANADALNLAYAMNPTYDAERAGHDFWLTRNRHGAGFWDRGLGPDGDALTRAAHAYGSCDAYLGDDGEIHLQ